MTISELMAQLHARIAEHGDVEVRVHCSNCCPHAHEITNVAIGRRKDEADMLVIEV